MHIDPAVWPEISGLFDEWLDLPEDHRAGWLDGLEPRHQHLLPALHQMIAKRGELASQDFLDALPSLDLRFKTHCDLDYAAGIQSDLIA